MIVDIMATLRTILAIFIMQYLGENHLEYITCLGKKKTNNFNYTFEIKIKCI